MKSTRERILALTKKRKATDLASAGNRGVKRTASLVVSIPHNLLVIIFKEPAIGTTWIPSNKQANRKGQNQYLIQYQSTISISICSNDE